MRGGHSRPLRHLSRKLASSPRSHRLPPPTQLKSTIAEGRGGYFMEQIRVCTYDGPGAQPVIRSVPWPKIPRKAALIKVGACGVCGTDLHILKGHGRKQLPCPFTLGHELGGVLVEVGSFFKEDCMSKPLTVWSKVMIPP